MIDNRTYLVEKKKTHKSYSETKSYIEYDWEQIRYNELQKENESLKTELEYIKSLNNVNFGWWF